MALVINFLAGLEPLVGQDVLAQLLQSVEDRFDNPFDITLIEFLQQLLHLREAFPGRLQQLGTKFLEAEIILFVEQLKHAGQQRVPSPFLLTAVRLSIEKPLQVLLADMEQVVDLGQIELLDDPLGQHHLFVDERPPGLDPAVDFRRQVRQQHVLVSGPPEREDHPDKVDDQVGTLDMALLSQKMDEHVLAAMGLIQCGRHVAQVAFGADLVEEDRHQFGELFGQVVDRFDLMVEQFGDIALEQVGILDAGAGQFQMNDQGRKQGRTPFRFLHDQVQPDPDIAEMGRVDDRLPVLVDPGHIGRLEAKANDAPEEGLDHSAVAPLKDFPAENLNTLQRGMRIPPDVDLEQTKGGQQEFFDFFKTLLPDQDDQASIDFPKRLLVDQVEPLRVHDFEHEQQLMVLVQDRGGIGTLDLAAGIVHVDAAEMAGNLLIEPDDIDVRRQFEQSAHRRFRVDGLLLDGLQFLAITEHRFMGNGGKRLLLMKIVGSDVAPLEIPGERVILTKPVIVIFPEKHGEKRGNRPEIEPDRRPIAQVEQPFDDPFDRLLAMDKMHQNVAVLVIERDQSKHQFIDNRFVSLQVVRFELGDELIQPGPLGLENLTE